MSRWIEVARGRSQLPKGFGVYVVYENNVVVYVGSSTQIERRCRVYWRTRRHDGDYDGPIGPTMWQTPWDFVSPGSIRIKVKFSKRLGDWLMWEYRLIHRLQPRYNRAGIAR